MLIVCITGASGSGKTTLIRKLVAHCTRLGLRVGTLKHAHHDFDMDKKGKDSQKHFEAGARVSAVVSPHRTAVFARTDRPVTPKHLAPHFRGCDLLIVEGFKQERLPTIEVFRRAIAPTLRTRPRAVVTADPIEFSGPRFRPNQISQIADFILNDL
jgi:molybdopterin-guanine dinucleotide biosynthesis protein MobB